MALKFRRSSALLRDSLLSQSRASAHHSRLVSTDFGSRALLLSPCSATNELPFPTSQLNRSTSPVGLAFLSTSGSHPSSETGKVPHHHVNPPDTDIPDAATLREQWRYATRMYSKWYANAWGTAILAGLSFYGLGWWIKGENPLWIGRKAEENEKLGTKEDNKSGTAWTGRDEKG